MAGKTMEWEVQRPWNGSTVPMNEKWGVEMFFAFKSSDGTNWKEEKTEIARIKVLEPNCRCDGAACPESIR